QPFISEQACFRQPHANQLAKASRELLLISWIWNRYMDTPFLRAAFKLLSEECWRFSSGFGSEALNRFALKTATRFHPADGNREQLGARCYQSTPEDRHLALRSIFSTKQPLAGRQRPK